MEIPPMGPSSPPGPELWCCWRGRTIPGTGRHPKMDACFRQHLPGLCHRLLWSSLTMEETRQPASRPAPLLSDRAAAPARDVPALRRGSRASGRPGQGWVGLLVPTFPLSLGRENQ